jgi:hypothetical protein
MTDKQMAVVKKFGDTLTYDLGTPMTAASDWRLRGTSARQLGRLGRELFAQTGHDAQHGFGQFFQRVKLADLMGNIAKNLGNRLRIQGRGVRGDAANGLAANGKNVLQPSEKMLDVGVCGIVIQHLVQQATLLATVHDRQHTERSVIKFVGSKVTGKVGQRPIKIGVFVLFRFFFPKPRSSFGWWRRERKHDDRARGARRRVDRANHPRPPNAPPRQ